MVGSASDVMSGAVGKESFNDRWRKYMRRRLGNIAEKMIIDYIDRRKNHGCDTTMLMSTDDEEEEEDLERGLPEACRDVAKPIKLLGRNARNWANTYNSCGTGPPREARKKRIWTQLRKLRSKAYTKMGCYE